ncbi:copper amine oxidase N-terminal domain-containing protein [Paenibacillus tritici]|uniref:Copper amine oxidase N-terminal domain-containing protein n=1 Tax=Paenibacillus tritici TaxID=1873425 RepID=A0ABX2DQZ5_9BACL|nr:copper amine oxidase N-terminal domain-containing protein [Paenibacillus tritici]NQX45861.1 copper amine oxidase N-terminal domain-containing protein [Paenibacillus tritici]
MFKVKIPAAALLTVTLMGCSPLTASAPISASAATPVAVATTAIPTTTAAVKTANPIKVQNADVTMIFDGVALQPPAGQYVFMYNNTTYIPLRFMSYALQKSVAWDAKNLKVTVAEPSSSELVVIQEYLMNAASSPSFAAKNLALNNVNASYVFNGSNKALPKGQSSYLLNGSIYVPLRFLSESVGNSIIWNPKTMTITASSKNYEENTSTPTVKPTNNGSSPSASPAPTPTPAPAATTAPGGSGAGGTGTSKVSYESITSETEAKLSALQSQSQSTLMGIAFEYVSAIDSAAKQSIKAKGIQQLDSFTASFNSIIADAEQKLNSNGYSTDVIKQYRSEFESQLQLGKNIAEKMAG